MIEEKHFYMLTLFNPNNPCGSLILFSPLYRWGNIQRLGNLPSITWLESLISKALPIYLLLIHAFAEKNFWILCWVLNNLLMILATWSHKVKGNSTKLFCYFKIQKMMFAKLISQEYGIPRFRSIKIPDYIIYQI